MKKLLLPILFCLLFLAGCKEKMLPAELKIYDEAGNETILTIHTTNDSKEVADLLNQVDKAYLAPYSFTTAHLFLNTAVKGALTVELNQKKTDIELDYQIDASTLLHFKSFSFTGSVELKGSDKTESVDFSSENSNHMKCDFQNDNHFLYLNGALMLGNNKINLKGKTSFEQLQQYRAFIVSFPELIRHKKLTYFLGDIESFVADYQVAITHTTKDSFTLCLNIPAEKFDPQSVLSGSCKIEVEISCQNFLPISFTFSGADIIEEALRKKYVEKYLTDQVSVSEATLECSGHIVYGNETLSLLNDEEKEAYTEFDWKAILDQFKNYI